MSKVTVSYLGGIDDKSAKVNLTGSQSIFGLEIGKSKGVKIVVDAGAVQGVKNAHEINKKVKREVLGSDCLVITHAHSDHVGMVPYLIKKGFSGRIIMTELTKLQSKEMWFDYVRLVRNEIEKIGEINSKIGKKLKDSLSIKLLYENVLQPESYINKVRTKIEEINAKNKRIKIYYEKFFTIKTAYKKLITLNPNGTEKEKKDIKRLTLSLSKIIGNDDFNSAYDHATGILNKNNIYSETDIDNLLVEVPNLVIYKGIKNDAEVKLYNLIGNTNYEIAYSESLAKLKEYGVESEKDISSVLYTIPELLFDEDDIDLAYNKIEILELKEELELQNFSPISSGKDERIKKLPEMVKNGFNKQIPVLSVLKGTVTSVLRGLIDNISKKSQENEKNIEENKLLKDNLTLALNYVSWYEENGAKDKVLEREFLELINEDEEKILSQIAQIRENVIFGKKYDLFDLLKKYQSFKYIPKSSSEYKVLNEELHSLRIKNEDDIDFHLPELPDRDYENKDIKQALKNALVTDNESVSLTDYAVYIENTSQYSPQEILSFFRQQKRVYIGKSIYNDLLHKITTYVNKNQENIKRNFEIKQSLYESYDLIEIYEGNRELFLEKNKSEYKKALKYVSNFKGLNIKESKITNDDLDYLLDINYEDINKSKTIIYIKRLDDARLNDILFNENSNTVFYFEPKIRLRVKEKLIDYISKIEKDKEFEKEKITNLNYYLDFIRIYEGKEKIDISKQEYNNAKKLLKKHSIKQKIDIDNFDFFDVDLNYEINDIEQYFKLSNFVEDGFSIDNIEFIFIKSIDDERIYDLPFSNDNNEKIYVIKDGLKEEIKKKLLKSIGDFYKTSLIRKKKRKDLLEKIKLKSFYNENYDILFGLDGFDSPIDFYISIISNSGKVKLFYEKLNKVRLAKELNKKLSKQANKTNGDKKQDYIDAKSLLERYNIKTIDDILNALKTLHYIPYSIDDIKKAISLLKNVHIDKNQDILESVKLNFFDAGHIEGSVQSVVSLVVSSVDNLLENGGNKKTLKVSKTRKIRYTNFGFSGDLGRINDPNLAGSPEEIPFKLDYYQLESTYAGRNHIDKEIAIDKLFSSIDSAKGKVLIPSFSMQRTQEILMILLKRRLDSQEYIDQVKELIKQKNDKQKQLSSISKNLPEWTKKEMKEQFELVINNLELNINYLKIKIFDEDIILDSPLSEKITEIYIEKNSKKYNLLDRKVQKELFGKEIITYVKKTGKNVSEEENGGRMNLGDLYTPERRDKKEIIFSASGMGDGGSIIPHLKESISNTKSKIIWVGYCPPNTRGGKIKAGDEFISIDGEAYELKCDVDDIDGFSGHIDEKELLQLLTKQKFKKGATLVLTHGDVKRFELAEKIRVLENIIKNKVRVVVPNLGDKLLLEI